MWVQINLQHLIQCAAHDVFIYQVSFQCAASAAYVNHNVQHQGMLHVFRVYLGATIAALFQQIAFPTFPDLQKAWRDVGRGVSYLGRDVNHHSVCLC